MPESWSSIILTVTHEMHMNQPRQMPHRDLPKLNSSIKLDLVPRPWPFLAELLPKTSGLLYSEAGDPVSCSSTISQQQHTEQQFSQDKHMLKLDSFMKTSVRLKA